MPSYTKRNNLLKSYIRQFNDYEEFQLFYFDWKNVVFIDRWCRRVGLFEEIDRKKILLILASVPKARNLCDYYAKSNNLSLDEVLDAEHIVTGSRIHSKAMYRLLFYRGRGLRMTKLQ